MANAVIARTNISINVRYCLCAWVPSNLEGKHSAVFDILSNFIARLGHVRLIL